MNDNIFIITTVEKDKKIIEKGLYEVGEQERYTVVVELNRNLIKSDACAQGKEVEIDGKIICVVIKNPFSVDNNIYEQREKGL